MCVEDGERDLLLRGEGLEEKLQCGTFLMPGGCANECKRTGTKRESGTEHEACNLVRNIMVM